jgi:hypothetical protein
LRARRVIRAVRTVGRPLFAPATGFGIVLAMQQLRDVDVYLRVFVIMSFLSLIVCATASLCVKYLFSKPQSRYAWIGTLFLLVASGTVAVLSQHGLNYYCVRATTPENDGGELNIQLLPPAFPARFQIQFYTDAGVVPDNIAVRASDRTHVPAGLYSVESPSGKEVAFDVATSDRNQILRVTYPVIDGSRVMYRFADPEPENLCNLTAEDTSEWRRNFVIFGAFLWFASGGLGWLRHFSWW